MKYSTEGSVVSKPEFFVTPGAGTMFREHSHYNQSVRLGDVVHIAGQGGWDDEIRFPADLDAEVVRAFDNVEKVLAQAGASWADVVAVDRAVPLVRADRPRPQRQDRFG